MEVGSVEASETSPAAGDGAGDGGRAAAVGGSAGRWWLPWVGVGLVVAGLTCGVWALRSPVAPARGALPPASWIGLVVPMLALVAAGRAARRRDPHRRRALVGVVGAAFCAVVVARAAWSDVGGGLPRMAVPLSAVALLWLTLGALLLAVTPERASSTHHLGPWASRRPVPDPPSGPDVVGEAAGRWRVGAVVAVVAGIGTSVLAAGGSWALEHPLAVDATTASPPGDAPPLVAPERVAWTWEQSGDARGLYPGEGVGWPGDVVAAGTGLAVDDGDGVVALDGASGEERWHYRRPGASVGYMNASPSGAWVVAEFPSGTGSGDSRVVALNGATGQVGLDLLAAASHDDAPGGSDGRGGDGPVTVPALGSSLTWVTDNTLVTLDPGRHLTGYDLATGERSWSWQPPDDGCDYVLGSRFTAVGRDTVLISARCGPTDVELVALDDRTGDERWRTTVPEFERGVPSLMVSPAGDVVTHEENTGEVVVDTDTGELLWSGRNVRVSPGREFAVTTNVVVGDSGLIVAHRSDDTVELIDDGATAATVTVSGCGDDEGDATVADTLIVACTGADRDTPPEDQHPNIRIVPWDNPDATRTVDLETLIEGEPVLIVTPHVVAVTGRGSTRLAVLGPG